MPIEDLPEDTIVFLLGSRYCETDALSELAWKLFGNTPPGWARVQAICDYVHDRIAFDYQNANPLRTAWGGHADQTGVCRDFAHLAITFCRCMNIPARYCTGYLGDGAKSPALPPDPMVSDDATILARHRNNSSADAGPADGQPVGAADRHLHGAVAAAQKADALAGLRHAPADEHDDRHAEHADRQAAQPRARPGRDGERRGHALHRAQRRQEQRRQHRHQQRQQPVEPQVLDDEREVARGSRTASTRRRSR